MKKLKTIFKKHWTLLFTGFFFFFLLLRNPYSTRTLIPNLEPFPDAFFYTTTPRCLIEGRGWKMCRLFDKNKESFKPAVPPAYSILLVPGYLINFDVRTFYFTNVLIALSTLYLFYIVLGNFFKNQYIVGLLLFFYVTNYFSYWLPTLAMSENLLIPVFLLSVLLLQNNKISKTSSLIAGIVSAAFYGTKFSFLPLTALFPIFYFIKIIQLEKIKKEKILKIIFLILPVIIFLLIIFGKEQAIILLNQLTNGAFDSSSSQHIKSGGGYFSINYFPEHIKKYGIILLGKSQRFLWDNTPLVDSWIALPGIFGILISFRKKKNLLTKIWLVIAIIAELILISNFYSIDSRYLYHCMPILLIGFGFFLNHLNNTLLKNKINFFFFIGILFIIYFIPNIIRLKSAIMINLKYSETPWWYLSQLEMNKYFDTYQEQIGNKKRPVLVTLSSQFLTDNYSNRNYDTLPLNVQQDFEEHFAKIYGPGNYKELIKLYKEYILDEYNVFVTNYGVSASSSFQDSYRNIEDNFNLTLMQSGCYNLCNVYKLEIKDDNISK